MCKNNCCVSVLSWILGNRPTQVDTRVSSPCHRLGHEFHQKTWKIDCGSAETVSCLCIRLEYRYSWTVMEYLTVCQAKLFTRQTEGREVTLIYFQRSLNGGRYDFDDCWCGGAGRFKDLDSWHKKLKKFKVTL